MRIGILTQYYSPELGAPQARLSDLAGRLAERGHQVYVLTAMPSYPQGRLYPGYGGWLRIEQLDSVRVIRTLIYPTQQTRLLPRLANYFSFVASSWLIGGWFLPRLDYLLSESPPLFLGLSAYLLSRWKRARWIFNVSDLWPESAARLGFLRDGAALRLSYALEAFCYRKAWLVTGQSRSILEDIERRFPGLRLYHFSNGVDVRQFRGDIEPDPADELKKTANEVIALYAGLHGVAQGLEQILQAASRLRDVSTLRFVLVGDGPEKRRLQEMAAADRLSNLVFLDPLPKERMPAILAAADICIVPLKTHIPGAVPSKLYEAMAAQRPIVFIGDGEPAQIVNRHQAGFVLQPGDIDGAAQALRRLAEAPELRQRMGAAGRRAAEMHFDRRQIFSDFEAFLLLGKDETRNGESVF